MIILSVVFYFLGLRAGEYFSYHNQMSLCDLQKELLIKAKEIERIHSISDTIQNIDNNLGCITTSSVSDIQLSPQKVKKKQLCIPAFDQRKNLSVLHIGKATVPEDVFSFLHHPSSPAKWSYFFTQQPKNWKSNYVSESSCNEIYLTRTGSRASQPNKCIAVTFVPNGSESIGIIYISL